MLSSKSVLLAAASLALGIAAVTTQARAQRARAVPQAIAVVQAPESAVEVCHGSSAQAALECARKRCERKAGRGACFAVTACEPAGWAGVMGVKMSEVHFSNTVCGAPTREAAITALRAFCEGHAGSKQCAVTQLWSPDGKQHAVNFEWTPHQTKQ